MAQSIGQQAANLPLEQACYQLSATYTALVPSSLRSAMGMYYTPPALTKRLLDMAEESGIDWRSAHILDPACGGGAFLLPVALRMREALERLPPALRLETIQNQLRGFEIDPFAAWLTQTWVELALSDLLAAAGKRLSQLVQVCDTLNQEPSGLCMILSWEIRLTAAYRSASSNVSASSEVSTDMPMCTACSPTLLCDGRNRPVSLPM